MRRLLVAAVAVVLVPLSGCSEEEPKAEPTPKPSVSESVAPKEETAEEFIRRWFQVQEDMQNSGDTTEYRDMAPKCEDCQNVADRIAGIYESGGDVQYGGHDVVSVKKTRAPKTYKVRLEVKSTLYSERAGDPQQTLRGGTDDYRVTVDQSSGKWLVTHLSVYAA